MQLHAQPPRLHGRIGLGQRARLVERGHLVDQNPPQVAIVGAPDAAVARAVLAPFEPTTVVAFGPADDVPLLEGKTAQGAEAAVYVCERFACQAPVTDPAELAA